MRERSENVQSKDAFLHCYYQTLRFLRLVVAEQMGDMTVFLPAEIEMEKSVPFECSSSLQGFVERGKWKIISDSTPHIHAAHNKITFYVAIWALTQICCPEHTSKAAKPRAISKQRKRGGGENSRLAALAGLLQLAVGEVVQITIDVTHRCQKVLNHEIITARWNTQSLTLFPARISFH